jgi:aspartyl-tRNA(Asn)/glutamyl-tRNA(Gln) amidotransferase subunit B
MLKLMDSGIISGKIAKSLLIEMIETGKPPSLLVKEKGLEQISDEKEIEKIIEETISENSKIVNDYKSGKQNAIIALVGKVMAKTKGKANPQKVNEILRKRLM